MWYVIVVVVVGGDHGRAEPETNRSSPVENGGSLDGLVAWKLD